MGVGWLGWVLLERRVSVMVVIVMLKVIYIDALSTNKAGCYNNSQN